MGTLMNQAEKLHQGTRVEDWQGAIYSTVCSRALSLLLLRLCGRATTPYEWLAAQIDAYSSLICRVESLV
jgi:hypothetical protein